MSITSAFSEISQILCNPIKHYIIRKEFLQCFCLFLLIKTDAEMAEKSQIKDLGFIFIGAPVCITHIFSLNMNIFNS